MSLLSVELLSSLSRSLFPPACILEDAMKITIIASEGGAGYYPENTAYAVRQSLAAGVDGCELDFHLTADNAFVAHHDYLLNPTLTRDEKGSWLTAPGPVISRSSLRDLQRYDVGCLDPDSKVARRYPGRASRSDERIATFQEIEKAFLENAEPDAELWFEAKTDPFDLENTTRPERYVEELARQLGPSPLFSRTVLIAFDWRLLELAQIQMPGIQTGFLTIDFSWLARSDSASSESRDLSRWFGNFDPADYGGSLPRSVEAAGGSYWSPYFRDLSVTAVAEAHDLGIRVSTWGADTESEIGQAIATGVDSLTTGYVDRAGLSLEEE